MIISQDLLIALPLSSTSIGVTEHAKLAQDYSYNYKIIFAKFTKLSKTLLLKRKREARHKKAMVPSEGFDRVF